MNAPAIGKRFLITTDNWFFAPDGENYRAVWGTVNAIHDSESILGVKTNAKSTNWYIVIGDMIIAGCQIHYCVRCNECSAEPPMAEVDHEGRRIQSICHLTRIYNADESGLTPY